jgi:hypothetical protein
VISDLVSEAALHRYASFLLFWLLVISLAFAQIRPDPPSPAVARAALAAGQAASILAMLSAMVVLLTAVPDRSWPLALIGVLLVVRGVRFGVGDTVAANGVYTVFLAATCSVAGALILLTRPGLLRTQFAVFCALSVPLMIMQMVGVSWTQLLRTDMGPIYMGYQQVPTLFVPAGEVIITTFQSRPAGFLYANNAASLIAVFGVALHYARLPKPGRLDWTDVAVLAFLVLLMSRLAFIVLLLMWIVRASMGGASRRHVLASIGVVAILLAAYWLAFPGLFAANMSWYALAVDLEIRIVELMLASGVPWVVQLADQIPREWAGRRFDPMQHLGTGGQSGYGMLIRHPWLVLLAVVAAVPAAWAFVSRFRRLEPDVQREVTAVGLTAILAPAITSFLGTPMFWFLSAAAVIPFWLLLDPMLGKSLRAA